LTVPGRTVGRIGPLDFFHFFALVAISFSRFLLLGSVRKFCCGQWIDFFPVLGFQWEKVAKTKKTRAVGLASVGRARSCGNVFQEKSPGFVESWGE